MPADKGPPPVDEAEEIAESGPIWVEEPMADGKEMLIVSVRCFAAAYLK